MVMGLLPSDSRVGYFRISLARDARENHVGSFCCELVTNRVKEFFTVPLNWLNKCLKLSKKSRTTENKRTAPRQFRTVQVVVYQNVHLVRI